MKILTTSINEIDFDYVVAFQQEANPEGTQLDYKKTFPDKGLAKIIASFANTRGGVLIIGIEEDSKTGVPIKADGITLDKHVDRVFQYIGNISPIPKVECHTTNEVNGKVFVVVRVFEGDETPYYVHNDSNIWVRTGNVSKPIDIASPEATELLFKKKERAALSRMHNKQFAENNFQAFLKMGEKERLREITAERENYELKKIQHEDGANLPPFKSKITNSSLGKECSLLKVVLQPYYPHEAFIRPLDIEPIIQETRTQNGFYSFPMPSNFDSVTEGMIFFNWSRDDGEITCQQVFANGLVFNSHDILRHTPDGPATHLGWFAGELYVTLTAMRKILGKMGYQGSVTGAISIDNIEGVTINPIIERMWPGETRESIFKTLFWQLDLDTRILNDKEQLLDYVTELVRDIHWSFGYKDLQKTITKKYLVDKDYLKVD